MDIISRYTQAAPANQHTIILIKIFQIENNLNALCLPGTSLFKNTDIMETYNIQTHRTE